METPENTNFIEIIDEYNLPYQQLNALERNECPFGDRFIAEAFFKGEGRVNES